MNLIYDNKNNKKEIRDLYQEIFEDPEPFAEYYFTEVYAKNKVLMARRDEELLGTIHLNPYRLKIGKEEMLAHYIVAVATKKECRRQGIMRKMLSKVLCDMSKDEEAFTYLEPANPAYYEPFDFVFAMDWSQESFLGALGRCEGSLRSFQVEKDAKKVVSFIEDRLKAYDIHTKITSEYLERLQKEARCQDGDLMLWEKDNLEGVFMYGIEEDTAFLRQVFYRDKEGFYEVIKDYFHDKVIEITSDHREAEKKEPSIMVRITNLKKMIQYIRAKEECQIVIEVEDPIIADNQGIFKLTLSQQEGRLERTKEQPQLKLHIKELTRILFGKETCNQIKSLIPFQKVYITEEV